MSKHKKWIIRLAAALAVAAAMTALAASGLLGSVDGAASDWLYQRPEGTDGEIVVIGIDQRALDELGPMPWPRSYIAEAIEYLNSDPDAHPAAIGIDVLFIGESADPDADAYLVEAAEQYGNVLCASAATFGSEIVHTENGEFYLDDRAVLAWDSPYDALAAYCETGHINAMHDSDGVIRHMMLWIDVPGVGRVPSFSRRLYEMLCDAQGVTPNAPPETNAEGFFYLPFTDRPRGYYDGISVIDLLTGEVDSTEFADKIVLIGPYAAGMQDDYVTSVDHAKPMYGIEIQANAIDAFRAGYSVREVGERLQLALVFLLCAASLYWFYDRRVLLSVAGWLAVSLGWLGLCVLFYRSGHLLHVLYVPLFVTVLLIATVAVNYVHAQREKHRVQNTFGHYIDPGVMKQLIEQGSGGLELGGKLYDIAVLFVDIRGFTTMSEALDPPTVVEIINKYLTLTTECIMKNHGTLDKFVGDCTMAFWNAPLPQDDAIYLACRAAMDMVEGSKAVGEELMERFGRTVSFGVGVNYGPAVVGNIGAPKRMDYTAIGDTVNTAARLEANAPGGTVYISRAVADALGERAKTTSLGGSIKLKGKAEGFEVLTLDALE
ncbi:MAG: adenylate/guanylate cyclase domain-containing protein [Ruminococcaceae bacterium]|jgi:adenylate cyclase|nr:adenylate/guanylate cyclase domain-containing protein [Oscillospiraceae bacterium]